MMHIFIILNTDMAMTKEEKKVRPEMAQPHRKIPAGGLA